MSPKQPVDPATKPPKAKKAVPTPSPNATVLTNAQAADRLGVSTKTLGRWRQEKGAGPPFMKPGAGVRPKTNTHVRYPKDALDTWIKDNSWASPLHKMHGWLVDERGYLVGPAPPEERGDDVEIASIYEALTDYRWTSKEAMTTAWTAWKAEKKLEEEEIHRSVCVLDQQELAETLGDLGRVKPKNLRRP